MNNPLIKAIREVVKPLAKRVKLTVGKFVIEAIDDSKGLQLGKITLLADEVLDQIERIQEYGFTSVPVKGCEGIAVFVGGNRGNGSIIATDDRRFRPKDLGEGDTAIYTKDGVIIKLLNGGKKIEVISENEVSISTKKATINATDEATITTAKANVVSDNINLGSGAVEKLLKGETFQDFFNSHTHVDGTGSSTTPPSSPSVPEHLTEHSKGS